MRATRSPVLMAVLVLGVTLVSACDLASLRKPLVEECRVVGSDAEPPPGGGAVEGRLATASDDAIPRADVFARDRASGVCFRVETDADATYRLSLPPGAYTVTARARIEQGDASWSLPMFPDGDDPFARVGGAVVVKDFRLELACEPERCMAIPIDVGGRIELANPPGATLAAPGDASIALVLTPTGPLVDGSAGGIVERTVSLTRLVRPAAEGLLVPRVPNIPAPMAGYIPLGPYTATAALVVGGVSTPLELAPPGGDWAASVPIAFTPEEPWHDTHTGVAPLRIGVRTTP